MSQIPPFKLTGLNRFASIARQSRPVDGAPPSHALPPVAAYDPGVVAIPPPLPPIVADGVGDDYESALRTWTNMFDVNVASAGPTVVYATQRRWRAVDVYVATDFVGALGQPWVTIGIYAIARGVRTLVATGRIRGAAAGDFRRVAAARVEAEKFEIVATRSGTPASATQTMQVAIVASDEANDVNSNELDGAITPIASGFTGYGPTMLGILAATGVAQNEGQIPVTPAAIVAQNEVTGVRYLQLTDAVASAGNFMVWQIPAGASLYVTDRILFKRFQKLCTAASGLVLRQSSTPVTYTASADLTYQFYFR